MCSNWFCPYSLFSLRMLALAKHALDETKKEKDHVIEMKSKEIESLKQKMEDMVVEFEHMLKETLSKMGNTITEAQKGDEKGVSEELMKDEKLKEFVGRNLLFQ